VAKKQNILIYVKYLFTLLANIKILARTAKVCYMSKSVITVTVKLFAAYQEAFRVSELVLEFPDSMPVKAVCDRLIAEHPELSQWRDITRFGINLIFVEPDTLLQDGDEVVLIPPVSGG
jgi:molybdopterin synthase sulfur carrier subunit